jgi:UDP-GlcNAc3NAcA epimerase
MIKILNIIGARPQIIKASAISRAIKNNFSDQITEVIVHTGQHYDHNMSGVFMEELNIPELDYNLNIGSGSHGSQTAKMIESIESVILKEKPNWVMVYGDTNSTLAAAIAASKLHIPIAHVEAGLRSHNKQMPEEINRILCDHVSTLLFSPTLTGINNLINEGFSMETQKTYSIDSPGVFHCGDIMYDNTLFFNKIAERQSTVLQSNGLVENKFILCTIHRPSNTDSQSILKQIVESLIEISHNEKIDIVLPLHPRTKSFLEKYNLYNYLKSINGIKLLPPASFLDITLLESKAKFVITDSGGVQKEAYFFKKPCLILRKETEWIEIIENHAGVLADPSSCSIAEKFEALTICEPSFPKIFGDGKAANYICERIVEAFI